MAIAPHDPRHPDLTASDILSPQTWPRRGIRPAVGLDVICTKIAVDFQSMTAVTAADFIAANLELLREATRTDTAFHIHVGRGGRAVHRNPGGARHADHRQSGAAARPDTGLVSLAAIAARAAAGVGDARYRQAAADQSEDAAVWCHLGIGSVLVIGYFIEGRAGRPARDRGRAAARELGSAAASAR